MNPSTNEPACSVPPYSHNSRLDYLDATRAFALLLGIVFHASLSFMPFFMGWAVQDISTSSAVGTFALLSHSFRMETFFLLAGLLSCAAFYRKGAGGFVRARLLHIGVPFVVGWFLLRPLIVSSWIMGFSSLRGDYDFWMGIRDGFKSLGTLPAGIFTGTHLWFLYYLAMITALTLLVRAAIMCTRIGQGAIVRRADALVALLANSSCALPLLAAPTALTLWFMDYWSVDTPDRDLRPHIPVLALYGGFFVLGWLLNRRRELIAPLTRLTPQRWVVAGAGGAAMLFLSRFQLEVSHPHHLAAHVAYVVSYALAMWSMVFLTIGIFKKLCERPHAMVRYLADSSYWLYLVHLPIVAWLQVAVAEVPVHWSLKLAFISTATVALGLISYDLCVRSTWIGWLLNGRRRDRVVARLPVGMLRAWRGNRVKPSILPEGEWL